MSGLFFIKDPNGKPILSWHDFVPDVSKKLEKAKNLAEKIPMPVDKNEKQQTSEIPTAKKNDYYKWKDKNGSWQFTKELPRQGVQYNVVSADPKTNIIKSLSKKEINKILDKDSEENESNNKLLGFSDDAAKETEEKSSLPFPSTIPVTKIPQLIDAAKQVQELSNQRAKAMESL